MRASSDLPKSGVHRLLGQLVDKGWAEQDPATQRYRLTLRFALMGKRMLAQARIEEICQPILDAVARETGELVRLSCVQDRRLAWLGSAQGAPPGLMYAPSMTGRIPLHATANGKAWLSTLPEGEAVGDPAAGRPGRHRRERPQRDPRPRRPDRRASPDAREALGHRAGGGRARHRGHRRADHPRRPDGDRGGERRRTRPAHPARAPRGAGDRVQAAAGRARRPLADPRPVRRSPENRLMAITLRNVGKTYRRGGMVTHALDRVDLDIAEGEFVAIVGPSGCGKSTLLRLIAGLLPASSGEILVNGAPRDAPQRRDGHRVPGAGAAATGAACATTCCSRSRCAGLRAADYAARADELLRQRRACRVRRPLSRTSSPAACASAARSRARSSTTPSCCMMDEPFGALDALTREQMRLDLEALWMATRKTVLFITHSIDEAVLLADRVVVMSPRPGTDRAHHPRRDGAPARAGRPQEP